MICPGQHSCSALLLAVEYGAVYTVPLHHQMLYMLLQGFSTQLHRAAEAGSTKELSRLLLEGAPVNGEDEEGCTALHCAAAAGRSSAAEPGTTHGMNDDFCKCQNLVAAPRASHVI